MDRDGPQSPAHYFEIDLSPDEMEMALEALRHWKRTKRRNAMAARVLERFETATRVNMPLVRHKLNWDEIEAQAAQQGVSMADILYDRMGRMPDPLR